MQQLRSGCNVTLKPHRLEKYDWWTYDRLSSNSRMCKLRQRQDKEITNKKDERKNIPGKIENDFEQSRSSTRHGWNFHTPWINTREIASELVGCNPYETLVFTPKAGSVNVPLTIIHSPFPRRIIMRLFFRANASRARVHFHHLFLATRGARTSWRWTGLWLSSNLRSSYLPASRPAFCGALAVNIPEDFAGHTRICTRNAFPRFSG